MRIYKLKTLLTSLTIVVLSLMSDTAEASDEWIDNWKSFAAETGLP